MEAGGVMTSIDADGKIGCAMPVAAIVPPVCSDGEVHVWFAAFGPKDPGPKAFAGLLDPQETARANRFMFPHHRERFIRAHGILRLVLAAYVGVPPAQISFTAGSYGKPMLANSDRFEFSLSHSGDGVAVAVSTGMRIGVDIELPRDMNDRDEFVRRNFSAGEIAAYEATGLPDRDRAFFQFWTRKEAFLKGLGLGLSRPLDSFTVGLGTPVALDAPGDGDWSLHHLDPGDGFAGAVACDHPAPALHGWRLRFEANTLTQMPHGRGRSPNLG